MTLLPHNFLMMAATLRVETSKRFVQDKKFRFMNYRNNELDFLLIAFGKFLNAAMAISGEIETTKVFVNTLVGFC